MPRKPKPSHAESFFSPKKALIFSLENVLIPGKYVEGVDVLASKRFLKQIMGFCSKKGIATYLISAYPEKVCEQKVKEFGLGSFFAPENVRGVHSAYLTGMEAVDRARYNSKLADDAECTDEYFRQVEMQSIMKEKGWEGRDLVLIGHDYWFDGFYTRRYSQVDVAFVEKNLTSRGKPVVEHVNGLWYIPLELGSIKKISEGKMPAPNYAPLDAWASVTLTEELLGAKGFNMVKRVIIERKKPNLGSDFPNMVQ